MSTRGRFAVVLVAAFPLLGAAFACGTSALSDDAPPDTGAPAAPYDASTDAARAADAAPATNDAARAPDALVGKDAAALLRPLRPLSDAPIRTYLVRADASGVYLLGYATIDGGISFDDTRIVRLSPDGSAPPIEVLAIHDFVYDFALDDTDVYFALRESVGKVSKTGGMTTTLATGARMGTIAVYGSDVLYATHDDRALLYRIPKGGGAPFPLARDLYMPYPLAVGAAGAFVLEGGRLRLASLTGGDDAGSNPSLLAVPVSAFDVADDVAYYVNSGAAIEQVGAAGGTPVPVAAGRNIRAVAVDGEHAYFADSDGVGRAPRHGTGVVRIAADRGDNAFDYVQSMALDPAHGYVVLMDSVVMFDKVDPK